MLLRIIRMETIRIEFAQACRMSLLFEFRVSSETLLTHRSFRNDPVVEFSENGEKPLLGYAEIRAAFS